MITLLIATGNQHKVVEIRSILGERFRYISLAEFPETPAVEENEKTFEGNAARKAQEIAQWLSKSKGDEMLRLRREAPEDEHPFYVLADDSGLEVDALGGAPGVYSARFAAMDSGHSGNSSAVDNNAKLLRLLETTPLNERTARFRCVLALTRLGPSPGGGPTEPTDKAKPELFEGSCEGRIALAPRGENGFGYDPLFIPNGFDQTFGELEDEVKNRLSHRAKALIGLRRFLNS